MDEPVIKYYRKMLRGGFEYVGSLDSPSIFIDSIGENIRICGQIANNYLHLYISVTNGIIDEVKYMCTCDPTANVAVEILCTLLHGNTLEKAKAITEESFISALGGPSADLAKRAQGLLELLGRGILRYQQSGNSR
jgi:NifU-like protein involved in Fe-S cluster formation